MVILSSDRKCDQGEACHCHCPSIDCGGQCGGKVGCSCCGSPELLPKLKNNDVGRKTFPCTCLSVKQNGVSGLCYCPWKTEYPKCEDCHMLGRGACQKHCNNIQLMNTDHDFLKNWRNKLIDLVMDDRNHFHCSSCKGDLMDEPLELFIEKLLSAKSDQYADLIQITKFEQNNIIFQLGVRAGVNQCLKICKEKKWLGGESNEYEIAQGMGYKSAIKSIIEDIGEIKSVATIDDNKSKECRGCKSTGWARCTNPECIFWQKMGTPNSNVLTQHGCPECGYEGKSKCEACDYWSHKNIL